MQTAEMLQSLKVLAEKVKWIKCPFCSDEVTRLRPCCYWVGAEIVQSFVCSECAESVKGLTYMAVHHPIPGVDVSRFLPNHKSALDPAFFVERMYHAKVFLGDWSFEVWFEGGRLSVLESRKPPDLKKTYDNTYQVWFSLKTLFERGEDPAVISKTTWGRDV